MSIFGSIKHINTYQKVSFYSIIFEDQEKSLFELFVSNHSLSNAENLKLILTNIKNIGEKRGAHKRFFRHEGSAEALPLMTKYLNCEPGDLRLYCSVLSEDVVFLFNGGVKTANTAQECANVYPHFKLANKISRELTTNIKERNLIINSEITHRLEIGKDFELLI